MINFYDTRQIPKNIRKDYLRSIRKVISDDNLIDGQICQDFQEDFSNYIGVKHSVGVGNGFDALVLSLRALNIGPGRKVAVPSHTFIATWLAVLAVGATPIGIDVDKYGQIDLDVLEKFTEIDCVIVVHMHGSSCDMNRLSNWTKKHEIYLVEDCAQACGLSFQNKKVGSFGDISAFSFYPTKNLFAIGDGGAVCSNNYDLINKVTSISRYGKIDNDKYRHSKNGVNSRLDSIHAAVLQVNLKYLDEWNQKRINVAKHYNQKLEDNIPRLNFLNNSIFHHFIIFSSKRDKLRIELENSGIKTEIHYPNLSALEIESGEIEKYPVGSHFSSSGLSIPISPWQNKKTINSITLEINKIYTNL
jgi:dTDP-4-amino-4,6-dideoxygalactose transaminase